MDTQSLAKLPFNLKIIPTDENGIPNGVPFIAMFNPEQYGITEAVTWKPNTTPGKEGSDPTFDRINPREFTLDFMLDGTGVNTNGVKIPVTAQILLFRAATTSINALTHRPPYLIVQYGLFICTCIIKSSTVTYTMFDMFGLPIRAKVSATFTERTNSTLNSIANMLSSPDLTHYIQVKDWDVLPLLTYQVYRDQHYYLQVAKVNKLKNFRNLIPGQVLIFPPIAKK
jgi:hypothetical protein